MKHSIYCIISLAVLLLTVPACKKEKSSDDDILNGRPVTSLEVSYASEGAEVKGLSFSHLAARRTLQVNVNNPNLHWNLESNRDWCTVVPEEHRGSGPVTLMIEANEDFDAREEATLTFVAGDYRGSTITVNQSASEFIIGQPFFVAPMQGGSYTTKITTARDTEWSCEGNDWLEVTKGATVSVGDNDVTTLTVTPAENTSDSRYGAITLRAGSATDKLYLWQFGTDLDYDAEGNIYFPSGIPARFAFTVPAFAVKEVEANEYSTATVTENGDGTATVTITLADNLSDCSEVRSVNLSLLLNNAGASKVALPVLVQDYIAAHGLVTSKGLLAFAQAVAEGSDTSDWERDGVVTMIQDINMTGVGGWTGIGTRERPFTGSFDGGGYSVTYLTDTSTGLFNYCKDATIKNVTLGKGSSLYNNSDFPGDMYLGGIVSFAESTTISHCGFQGAIEFGAGTDADEASLYLGGIVGWADASSTIENSKMGGSIILSSSTGEEVTSYFGGIAGLAQGSLKACEVTGEVKYSSPLPYVNMGGMQGSLVAGATVGNNTFSGSLVLSGSALLANVGGLYGLVETSHDFDSASDKSLSMGSIGINSYSSSETTSVFAGGLVGKAGVGIDLSFKGYENKTAFKLNQEEGLTARYVCIGGILGGCDPEEEDGAVSSLTLDGGTNSGAISIVYKNSVSARFRHGLFGGVVGFVNGPATISNFVNNAAVAAADAAGYTRCGATSNDFCEVIGGIVGLARGGNLMINSCENTAPVTNLHYSNRPSTSSYDGMFCSQVSGGILGAFNYLPDPEVFTLTIDGCTNSVSGQVLCFRGYSGGVVGYCRNATITGCSSSGNQSASANDNAYYRGGIAGGVINATIRDCWSKCSINSGAGGSAEAAFTGGIVGWVLDEQKVTIDKCRFFGVVKCTKSGTKPIYPGGIVAAARESTVITDCKFGGTVQDMEITANNVSTPSNVVGNYPELASCSISGTEYWNGNL